MTRAAMAGRLFSSSFFFTNLPYQPPSPAACGMHVSPRENISLCSACTRVPRRGEVPPLTAASPSPLRPPGPGAPQRETAGNSGAEKTAGDP